MGEVPRERSRGDVMKKLALSLAPVLLAAVASAQTAGQAKPTETASAEKPAAARSIHTLEAEIVSVDTAKNSITFRVDGAEKTEGVGVLGRYRLKDLKAGDKVLLSCKDTDGQHQEIVAIRSPKETGTDKPAAKTPAGKN